MGLTFAQRLWPGVTTQPKVELLSATLTVVQSINLDIPKAITATTPLISAVMDDRMEPEKTELKLGDGRDHDVFHGFRFYVDLYYSLTNRYGRSILLPIIDHCKKGLYVKFYPNRSQVENWHICKLNDNVNLDRHPELYGAGYQIELSLKGVRREYVVGDAVPNYFTDFCDVTFAYVAGDRVRDFADVAAPYVATDKPGYFSPYYSGGDPFLPGL